MNQPVPPPPPVSPLPPAPIPPPASAAVKQPPPRAFDVFISHSSKDEQMAARIVAVLEKNGIRCWIAPRDIPGGAKWAAAIVQAIKSCRVFVLIYSQEADQSRQVLAEVERATALGAAVIPYRIQEFPQSPEMQYFLGATQWIDATEGNFKENINALYLVLSALLQNKVRPARGHVRSRWRSRLRSALLLCVVFLLGIGSGIVYAWLTTRETLDERTVYLADDLRSHIKPDTWDDVGGIGVISHKDGIISVTHQLHVHEAIDHMLESKRAAAHLPAGPHFMLQLPGLKSVYLKLFEQARNFEFYEAPLYEVLQRASEDHEIPIRIDTKSLEDMAVGTDSPVTYVNNEAALRDALRDMLKPLGLVYVMREDGLLITTDVAAEYGLDRLTVHYDVRDLVSLPGFVEQLRKPNPRVGDQDGGRVEREANPLDTKEALPNRNEESPEAERVRSPFAAPEQDPFADRPPSADPVGQPSRTDPVDPFGNPVRPKTMPPADPFGDPPPTDPTDPFK